MPRKRRRGVRRTERQWLEVLRQFEASGLGSRAFCDRDRLPLSSFQRWQKRLGSARPAKFVELVSPAAAPMTAGAPSWSLEVSLPNGASLRFQA
jgi:hypothetical protein